MHTLSACFYTRLEAASTLKMLRLRHPLEREGLRGRVIRLVYWGRTFHSERGGNTPMSITSFRSLDRCW